MTRTTRAALGIVGCAALVATAMPACDKGASPSTTQAADVEMIPASQALRDRGIDGYQIQRDTDNPLRAECTLFDVSHKEIGVFIDESEKGMTLVLGAASFAVRGEGDSSLRFSFGSRDGVVSAENAGFTGDADSLALWEQAKPSIETIDALKAELARANTNGPGGVRPEVATTSSRGAAQPEAWCHANPMYTSFNLYWLCNPFTDFNKVCRDNAPHYCPWGRVCSASFQACGGYVVEWCNAVCDCSLYGTGCSTNGDCCSNNCSSNGHFKMCH